jgi:hypothetical protein
VTLLLSLMVPSPAQSVETTTRRAQAFDTDPRWDARNNRVPVEPSPVKQDFGYSPTHRVRGKAAGEVGGRVQRCTTPAWYGMPLAAAKSWDDPLHCSGRLVVTETSGMSSVYFGWFNTKTMDTRPPEFYGAADQR